MSAQDDGEIQITWKPSPKKSPLDKIAEILKSGILDDGILLLELFLRDDPNDENVLFNLGMSYSNTRELNHAIEHLRHLVKSDPNHTHGRVARGLHLVCFQYVAFKKIAPEHSIGFDLSVEYQAALKLFGK